MSLTVTLSSSLLVCAFLFFYVVLVAKQVYSGYLFVFRSSFFVHASSCSFLPLLLCLLFVLLVNSSSYTWSSLPYSCTQASSLPFPLLLCLLLFFFSFVCSSSSMYICLGCGCTQASSLPLPLLCLLFFFFLFFVYSSSSESIFPCCAGVLKGSLRDSLLLCLLFFFFFVHSSSSMYVCLGPAGVLRGGLRDSLHWQGVTRPPGIRPAWLWNGKAGQSHALHALLLNLPAGWCTAV